MSYTPGGLNTKISSNIYTNGIGAITAVSLASVLAYVASLFGNYDAGGWAVSSNSIAVVSPGSAYAVNDTVTLACAGATFSIAPVETVTAVSSGGITGATLTNPGVASSISSPTCSFTQASTSGSGSGATFSSTFAPIAASLTPVPAQTLSTSISATGASTPATESVSLFGSNSTITTHYPMHSITIQDSGQFTSSGASVNAFFVNQQLNSGWSSATNGTRNAGLFQSVINATPGYACCTTGPGIVGLDAYGLALAPSPGTGNTSTTASSGIGAANFISELGATATHYWSNQIIEADIHDLAGSSLWAKEGIEVVQLADDAVAGTGIDCAFCLVNTGTPVGWKIGLDFGNLSGVNPVQSTGTLIGCMDGATACGTVGYGIDWRNYTFNTYSLALPGFTVGPSGVTSINAGTVAAGGNALVLWSNDGGNEGGQIQFKNTNGSATNPFKSARVSQTGDFQIINSAYTTAILDLTDGGALTVSSLSGTQTINAGTVGAGGNAAVFKSYDGTAEGGQIELTNTNGSLNKFFRVTNAGDLQILPSGYGANILDLTDGGVLTLIGAAKAPAFVATGSPPIASGTCAVNTQVGGNTAGSFKFNGACSAAGTVILTFATTAPTGWACSATDMTTPADPLPETAYSTTAATLKATAGASSADQAVFACTAF